MTAKETDTPSSLLDLYKTLDDSTEVLGALISLTSTGENVPKNLMRDAEKTLQSLASWRLNLESAVEILEVTDMH